MKRLLLPLLALAVAGCARSPEQDLVESLCDNLVRTMDLPAVSNLVENLGADVNGRSDYRHCTPLYTAIQNGNEPAVRYLLERGADPNRTGNTWKTGPGVLGFAASTGKLGIVQALVEAGANVRGVDPNSGEYPLARAAWYFRPEVLEYLYSKGAVREPGSKSLLVPDWHPPLDADGDARYARTLRVLVAHGENIDELSLWGPPVAYAAANNATNAMAVAIELGADVNPRAGTGKRTPLHEAVEAGHAEAVGLLMAHGADPFASWDDAKTKYKAKDGSAIALALALGRTDIVRMIEEGLRARTSAAPSSAEETHAESAETAEPEPHAESADSPLATALAGGEWIPLVVESVYIDATAPRELRKNWIVSFSGGIKARVHSPVKTFGESYGDLPGKRFGVRFVDRAAALAALHGTVYSGELEVRSAQGPVSAAANAAAEKEAAVRAKLDAIVFDSLEYQDANAADVISDLCERAREMDKDEPDPAKKGVSVVVGVDVKDIDEILARTTVTLKERSVSLGAALDRVADAIGLKVRVVGGCVLLGIYKGPLECRIFPVPPDLASRFLGDGNDWKARLAEIGIEWPDGTYVRYLMSVGRLTVYNTPDDLDRIERALSEATRSPAEERHAESGEPGGGSGEAQPPPVESHAEAAEGAE